MIYTKVKRQDGRFSPAIIERMIFMTTEEHIDELKLYLAGLKHAMCPASAAFWKEHTGDLVAALEASSVFTQDTDFSCIPERTC